jgi:hypothetical protein
MLMLGGTIKGKKEAPQISLRGSAVEDYQDYQAEDSLIY